MRSVNKLFWVFLMLFSMSLLRADQERPEMKTHMKGNFGFVIEFISSALYGNIEGIQTSLKKLGDHASKIYRTVPQTGKKDNLQHKALVTELISNSLKMQTYLAEHKTINPEYAGKILASCIACHNTFRVVKGN